MTPASSLSALQLLTALPPQEQARDVMGQGADGREGSAEAARTGREETPRQEAIPTPKSGPLV
jgi:hypothetical protein